MKKAKLTERVSRLDHPPWTASRGNEKHRYRRMLSTLDISCLICFCRNRECRLSAYRWLCDRIHTKAMPKRCVLESLCEDEGEVLRKRCERRLRTKEEKLMQYRNTHHEERFREILKSGRWQDRTMLAALFLLMADGELWRRVQSRITDMVIRFHDVRLAEISERGYTLFCGAKDLYFGTKTLCVTDLSDTAIVDSEAFDLIITAMAIKRYGTEVLRNGGKQE